MIFICLMLLVMQGSRADTVAVICFFPEKVNFEEINKTCNKGDLIRTRPNLAEMVCDWDKQIFQYREDDQDWITCMYHGEPRQVKQITRKKE